jgi:hypothetical protein
MEFIIINQLNILIILHLLVIWLVIKTLSIIMELINDIVVKLIVKVTHLHLIQLEVAIGVVIDVVFDVVIIDFTFIYYMD